MEKMWKVNREKRRVYIHRKKEREVERRRERVRKEERE